MSLPRRVTTPGAALASALLLPAGTPAAAQPTGPPDSLALALPQGRWGVEATLDRIAGGGRTGGGGGLLRMLSPRTALVLDLLASASGRDDPGDTQRSFDGQLALGLRRWRPVAPRLAGYVGGGALLTLHRATARSSIPGAAFEQTVREVGAGAYLQLGASYFVAPRLAVSVGPALTAVRSRSRNRTEAPEEPSTDADLRGTGWAVGLAPVTLGVAIFF